MGDHGPISCDSDSSDESPHNQDAGLLDAASKSLRTSSADSTGCGHEQCEEEAPVNHLPDDWEWPAWCLNHKDPCIEVFVEDSESEEKRWVFSEPTSRVVDDGGKDAFLCAEYEWDGNFYSRDFAPQHVRRRGDTLTVMEILSARRNDPPSHNGLRGGARLGKKDNGGGVTALLDDSMGG